MNEKENLLCVLDHGKADYTPFDLEYLDTVEIVSHDEAKFYRQNGDPDLTEWTDAWGTVFRLADPGDPYSAFPVGHPLGDLADLESFDWPDPDKEEIFRPMERQMARVDRAEKLIIAWNPGFLFVRSWLLRGMDNLLMDLMLRKSQVVELLDRIMSYQIRIIERTLDLGVDVMHFGDDSGTTKALMMNPQLWKELYKPRLKTIFDLCHERHAYVLFHSCGSLEGIVDDLVEIGVDILNPLQAGANNLEEVRKKTQGKITLYGGIDSHTVMTESPSVVRELAAETLKLLGRDGDYIMAPDQEFVFPRDNLDAIRETALELGQLQDGRLGDWSE